MVARRSGWRSTLVNLERSTVTMDEARVPWRP
jgi:hypothetical protein